MFWTQRHQIYLEKKSKKTCNKNENNAGWMWSSRANKENITKTPKKCSYKPIKKNNNRRIDAHLRRVKTTEKRKRWKTSKRKNYAEIFVSVWKWRWCIKYSDRFEENQLRRFHRACVECKPNVFSLFFIERCVFYSWSCIRIDLSGWGDKSNTVGPMAAPVIW